jgi:chromosome segregation ATPase
LSTIEEDRNEAKDMISPMHTLSCAPSTRKRPIDALEDGSGRNDTAAVCNTKDTKESALSIEAILKDMQQKMDNMQTEIDTTKAENTELKSKYYELESKVNDITSLKDESNGGSYDNISNIYDMQTQIDTLRAAMKIKN